MYLLGIHINPVTVVIASLIFLLSFFYINFKNKKYCFPPGPFPLPIVGNLFLFITEKDVTKVFKRLREKYGPVFRLKFGILDTIVVCNKELAIEALVKRQVDFAGRPNIRTFDLFSEGRKNISLAYYNEDLQIRRKVAYKAVKAFLSGPSLDKKVSISVNKVLDDMGKRKEAFQPHNYIDLMLFNVVADICHGTRYELDDPNFQTVMNANRDILEFFGNGFASDFIPWLSIFETSAMKKIDSMFEKVKNNAQAILDQHKENFDPINVNDFTDHLLLARHNAEKEGNLHHLNQLTDVHLRQIILDVIFAGTFTSSMTITWVILLVILHPDVQEKMHKEIHSILGKEKMTAAMKEKFPYCTAVIRESMRISPVFPFGLPRATTCDTKLGVYDIPNGMQVLFNIWDIHHDPEHWKNPYEFQPERFLTESGELTPTPASFLPFMAGRRVCLGESIAKPEMLIIVVSIFQRFQIFSPPGENPSMVGKINASGYSPPDFNIMLKERY